MADGGFHLCGFEKEEGLPPVKQRSPGDREPIRRGTGHGPCFTIKGKNVAPRNV